MIKCNIQPFRFPGAQKRPVFLEEIVKEIMVYIKILPS